MPDGLGGRGGWDLHNLQLPACAVAHAVAGTCSSLLEMVRAGREWSRINVPVLLLSLLGAQGHLGVRQPDTIKTIKLRPARGRI